MGDRWGTSRLEASATASSASLATLLVLEIAVPATQIGDLWRGIADQWPSYLAYATSFVTIGGIWLAHYGSSAAWPSPTLAHADQPGAVLFVAFLPFRPTSWPRRSTSGSSARAALFYGANLLAISMLVNAMWRYVVNHRALLKPDVTEDEAQAILRARRRPALVFYGAIIVLARLAPPLQRSDSWSSVIAVFRARGEQTPRAAPGHLGVGGHSHRGESLRRCWGACAKASDRIVPA